MDGWNTSLSYWGGLFSGAKTLVSGRVCRHQQPKKHLGLHTEVEQQSPNPRCEEHEDFRSRSIHHEQRATTRELPGCKFGEIILETGTSSVKNKANCQFGQFVPWHHGYVCQIYLSNKRVTSPLTAGPLDAYTLVVDLLSSAMLSLSRFFFWLKRSSSFNEIAAVYLLDSSISLHPKEFATRNLAENSENEYVCCVHLDLHIIYIYISQHHYQSFPNLEKSPNVLNLILSWNWLYSLMSFLIRGGQSLHV